MVAWGVFSDTVFCHEILITIIRLRGRLANNMPLRKATRNIFVGRGGPLQGQCEFGHYLMFRRDQCQPLASRRGPPRCDAGPMNLGVA
jgi:hypothetical protein